jgi:hypothetical protein
VTAEQTTLIFDDGRTVRVEQTYALHYVYRVADEEYTFRICDDLLFRQTSVKRLKWWQCDCGRGWYGGDSDPEAEAHGCYSCRTVVKVLDAILDRSRKNRR